MEINFIIFFLLTDSLHIANLHYLMFSKHSFIKIKDSPTTTALSTGDEIGHFHFFKEINTCDDFSRHAIYYIYS